MRYKTDANGYINEVFFGCYGNGCKEYTGTIPNGYTDLNDWSTNALINAYYLEDGNLVLDEERLVELESKIMEDTIDNEPLLRKDLYGSFDVLEEQYQTETATGKVIAIDNVKKINPKVKITNVTANKIEVITNTKNMLSNDSKSETISGVTFTKLISGGITITGTSTAAIEYNLSGSGNNTTSIFSLKNGLDYYLNIGDLECEMNYLGTTQVYLGTSGVINLPEDKEVTQVLLKIPSGTTLDTTIYPMLEYGTTASEYAIYDEKRLTIDASAYENIEYITIEDGLIYASTDGFLNYLGKGNVNLFDGFNTIYTLQDTSLEIEYNINQLKLEGTETKNKAFRIDDEGNVYATGGEIGGYTITENNLEAEIYPYHDFTQEDVTKLAQHLVEGTPLTREEEIYFDLNEDGILNTVDLSIMARLVDIPVTTTEHGTFEIRNRDAIKTMVFKDKDGNITTCIGLTEISTPRLLVGGVEVKANNNIYEILLTEATNSVILDNLNIVNDGSQYEITIYGATTINTDLSVQINDLAGTNYHQQGAYWQGTLSANGNLTAYSGYRPNMDRFYYGLSMRSSRGRVKMEFSLFEYNGVDQLVMDWESSYACYQAQNLTKGNGFMTDISTLNKISIKTANGNFMAGTRVILRKK